MDSGLNFARIKEIDQFTKDIVYGFMNQQENIASIIYSICLLFYHIKEQWTDHDQWIMLRDANRDIITNTYGRDRLGTVYGYHWTNNVIPCIYRWKIKILMIHKYSNMLLGINSSNKKYMNSAFHTESLKDDKSFYAFTYNCKYYVNGDTKGCSQKRWKCGNIITLELDTKRKTVKLYVNGIAQDLEYRNADCDVNYCLALEMNKPNDSVQIVDFQQIHQKM